MTIRAPFKPHYGTNQVITPAAASADIVLAKGDKSVRVRNSAATNIGYFRITASTESSAATTADMPVSPGETVIVEKEQDWTRMATISAAGTTFQVMTGEGGY
jgi:hypothetical protein